MKANYFSRIGWEGAWLGMPIIVLLGVFFVAPLFMMFSLAFWPLDPQSIAGADFMLTNFSKFLFDGFYLAAFLRTTLIAAVSTLVSIVLGYPVAWHLHKLRSSHSRVFFTVIVMLPMMLSLVVASFAWTIILGANGLINDLILLTGLSSGPVQLLNTTTGVMIVTAYSHLSYTVLAIFAALENIEPNLANAARIHGAGPRQTFMHVFLPLSLPGVVAGGLIVFALGMSMFVIPYLIGGGRVKVVPLLIYTFVLQVFDWPGAAALGVLLLLLTILLTWSIAALAQRWTGWEKAK
jgi:putative spermidine/putrescine transport system permease protein